jgi:hypothetical protein
MSKNGLKRLSTALAAAVAGVLLLAPTAHAATTAGVQQVQPGSVKAGAQYLQRGLTAVRFDPAVAAAHGFKIITLPDGSQQSVPVNPKDHRKPSPPIKAPGPVRSHRMSRRTPNMAIADTPSSKVTLSVPTPSTCAAASESARIDPPPSATTGRSPSMTTTACRIRERAADSSSARAGPVNGTISPNTALPSTM